MPVHTLHRSSGFIGQLRGAVRAWPLGGAVALMLTAIVAPGTASAQQAGYVTTAPSARAPNGLTIDLTSTQFHLLDLLFRRRPAEVPVSEILEEVWGFKDGLGGSDLVRAHIRNLRVRLAEAGLDGVIR